MNEVIAFWDSEVTDASEDLAAWLAQVMHDVARGPMWPRWMPATMWISCRDCRRRIKFEWPRCPHCERERFMESRRADRVLMAQITKAEKKRRKRGDGR